MNQILNSVMNFVELGGPVVALLLLLSVFAFAVILLKLWQLSGPLRSPAGQVAAAVRRWRIGDRDDALAGVAVINGPISRVAGHAMRMIAAGRAEAHVREQTENLILSEIASMRTYLRGLEAVVQTAPLLGLFGTVIGMIDAFRSLEAAGTQVNPSDLAGGIWVALLTTAVGLAIAMPVALVLHWFEGRIEREQRTMEMLATDVLTHPPAVSRTRTDRSDAGKVSINAGEKTHAY